MICLPALKLTALLHSLQQKTLFQNFMESLLQKSSKLRSLCKDLSKNYKLDSNTWALNLSVMHFTQQVQRP